MNNFTRRQFLGSAGLAAVSVGIAAGSTLAAQARRKSAATASPEAQPPPKTGKRPNVILYVGDDWGSGLAGCYGHRQVKTPGVDALAAEGIRMTHAFCTTASCSPSRSVLLSGMYNHANGMYGLQHAEHHFSSFETVRSLPMFLSQAGYRTARWGKYHVAPDSSYSFEQVLGPGGHPRDGADKCRTFIAEESNKPFFLYFCPTEPHRNFKRDESDQVDPKDIAVPSYLPDIPECRQDLAEYYASTQRCDKGLLRLIEILKDTGHWNDTVVIFLSDNGAPFPGAKTTLYEPGIRLPCVIRNPLAAKQGGVCNAMINYTDIAPTILDLCSATPTDYRFQGRSFAGVLDQENPAGFDEVFASHSFHQITMYYPMRMIRTRRHKLIFNVAHGLAYPFASDLYGSPTWQAVLKRGDKSYGKRSVEAYIHRPRFELYDLQEDPDETRNLADDPAHAGLLEELKNKLREFQKQTKDPWLHKWTYE